MLVSWCVCIVVVSVAAAARVRCSLGDVEGSEYRTYSGRRVYTFLGIPYAQPPIGANRFEAPKPPNSWSGVWEAKKQRSPCAQLNSMDDTIMGEENCLYLNVYTPILDNSANLPVLVYIHGGAFMMGSSDGFKPDNLLDHIDLVFVSVNYRLGPFGFLSTEDDVVPGNNGLKDQALALRWVKENIGFFGGNKYAVTISGNSAGGASVQYHYLSLQSHGTFQRGISSSGSALMPWAFTEQPLLKAKMLANSVGCPTDVTQEMIRCLKMKPSNIILAQVEPLLMPWLYNPFSPFGPVIEHNSTDPFLDRHPYQLLREGSVCPAPWLASITTEEGLYPGASFIDRDEYLESLNKGWLHIAPFLLDYNFTVPDNNKKLSIAKKVRHFYFEDKEISSTTSEQIIAMLGDRHFKSDMDLAVRTLASVSLFPVFFLTFGYRGNVSLSDTSSKTKSNFGVSHFDDIYYVLKPDVRDNLKSPSDSAMVRTMCGIWTSFIQHGLPSAGKGTVDWTPVSRKSFFSENVTFLFINKNSQVSTESDTNYGKKWFWSSLGFLENKNYL